MNYPFKIEQNTHVLYSGKSFVYNGSLHWTAKQLRKTV